MRTGFLTENPGQIYNFATRCRIIKKQAYRIQGQMTGLRADQTNRWVVRCHWQSPGQMTKSCPRKTGDPASAMRSPCAAPMLVQRLRRWASIGTAQGEGLVQRSVVLFRVRARTSDLCLPVSSCFHWAAVWALLFCVRIARILHSTVKPRRPVSLN